MKATLFWDFDHCCLYNNNIDSFISNGDFFPVIKIGTRKFCESTPPHSYRWLMCTYCKSFLFVLQLKIRMVPTCETGNRWSILGCCVHVIVIEWTGRKSQRNGSRAQLSLIMGLLDLHAVRLRGVNMPDAQLYIPLTGGELECNAPCSQGGEQLNLESWGDSRLIGGRSRSAIV